MKFKFILVKIFEYVCWFILYIGKVVFDNLIYLFNDVMDV